MDSNRKNVIESLSNKLIYYSLVTVLFKIKYSGSVVIIFMFLAAALTLVYSMTYYNYKVYPTKKLGKLLYWFSLLLKISYYYILMNYYGSNDNNFILELFCIYLLVDSVASLMYLIFPDRLLFPYKQEAIDLYFENKGKHLLKEKFRMPTVIKVFVILVTITTNTIQYLINEDLVYLVASILMNVAIFYKFFIRNKK